MSDSRLDWFYCQMRDLSAAVFSHPSPNDYLAALPEAKRCLFYVGSFLGTVDNGGVGEYLLGCHADDSDRAMLFLSVIGETEIAREFSGFCETLPAEFHACPAANRFQREEIFWGAGLDEELERVNVQICRRSDVARMSLVEHCQTRWE